MTHTRRYHHHPSDRRFSRTREVACMLAATLGCAPGCGNDVEVGEAKNAAGAPATVPTTMPTTAPTTMPTVEPTTTPTATPPSTSSAEATP